MSAGISPVAVIVTNVKFWLTAPGQSLLTKQSIAVTVPYQDRNEVYLLNTKITTLFWVANKRGWTVTTSNPKNTRPLLAFRPPVSLDKWARAQAEADGLRIGEFMIFLMQKERVAREGRS
jgi:hypothetical protein